jgi:pyruvyltransferase
LVHEYSLKIKVYWNPDTLNVGDTLTPHVVSHFRKDLSLQIVKPNVSGKLLAIGSVLEVALRSGDIVWGSGAMFANSTFANSKECKILAVRGPRTRTILERSGMRVPPVYGDPALLLPLMYKGKRANKKYRIGYVPHMFDYEFVKSKISLNEDTNIIDIRLPCRQFIDKILECERIVSSSLHGIIIPEAYGISVEWAIFSQKIPGFQFKFKDYFESTGRSSVNPGLLIEPNRIPDLQIGLINALNSIDILK